MKNLSLLATLALSLVSGALVGCSKTEEDPMTKPRAASTVDPATAPSAHVDRQGNPVTSGRSSTPAAAGGQTDRNGNPSGG